MKTAYLNWDDYLFLLTKLQGNKYRLLVAFQGMCGLRVGDALSLTWGDIVGKEKVELIEQKTKKQRTIYLNKAIRDIITQEYKGQNKYVYVFKGKQGNIPVTPSYYGKFLKKLFIDLNIPYEHRVSSHLFRKTFGRRYMDVNNWDEKALYMLNKVFGHSSIEITKIYLGIRDEEIKDVYDSLII